MKKPANSFELAVNNAGGPVQLLITNKKSGSGLRLLGSKGSPYGSTLHKWNLSESQLKDLIEDLQKILDWKEAMNEKLRKAIEEATRVDVMEVFNCGDVVDSYDHTMSQSKLLRVIEKLVEQRDCAILELQYVYSDEVDHAIQNKAKKISKLKDAELIAALEGK